MLHKKSYRSVFAKTGSKRSRKCDIKPQCCKSIFAQALSDDAFGELMQNHAHGRQNPCKNADRKSDGVNDAVDEGVKADR
jgi:hypothetical protein